MWNILTHAREFQEACNIAHSSVDGYIAKAREAFRNEKVDSRLGKTGRTRCVLAHDLIKETEDHVTIRNQLLNVFLPAHEATEVALTNVFFNLARHPCVYARLRKEVVEIAKSKKIWTFEGLRASNTSNTSSMRHSGSIQQLQVTHVWLYAIQFFQSVGANHLALALRLSMCGKATLLATASMRCIAAKTCSVRMRSPSSRRDGRPYAR